MDKAIIRFTCLQNVIFLNVNHLVGVYWQRDEMRLVAFTSGSDEIEFPISHVIASEELADRVMDKIYSRIAHAIGIVDVDKIIQKAKQPKEVEGE